jgi:hypothetical protein
MSRNKTGNERDIFSDFGVASRELRDLRRNTRLEASHESQLDKAPGEFVQTLKRGVIP